MWPSTHWQPHTILLQTSTIIYQGLRLDGFHGLLEPMDFGIYGLGTLWLRLDRIRGRYFTKHFKNMLSQMRKLFPDFFFKFCIFWHFWGSVIVISSFRHIFIRILRVFMTIILNCLGEFQVALQPTWNSALNLQNNALKKCENIWENIYPWKLLVLLMWNP